MPKVLVTGSSGFIGFNIINYFHNTSVKILPFSRAKGQDYFNINSDYLNNEEVNVIIHLAGKAHDIKNLLNEQDYFEANTDLTINIFDSFLKSNANTFIYFSSVKAVKDHLEYILTEDVEADPITAYGKSKLTSEKYLLSKRCEIEKRVIIFRPSMIHGPGNKGNLSLLYNLVSKHVPWPLGAFNNKRSFCSIENLCFIINEIINRPEIASGIYNIADDYPISTNRIIELIAKTKNRNFLILNFNRNFIKLIAKLGDLFKLPLTTERLIKLTESYVVCNKKIKNVIGKKLPLSTEEGLLKTFHSFIK